MKRLWSFLLFLLIPCPTLAATQKVPALRLDPLPDRILFILLLWLIIIALIVILRWKIQLADALFRMMPKEVRKSEHGKGSSPDFLFPTPLSEERKKEAPLPP